MNNTLDYATVAVRYFIIFRGDLARNMGFPVFKMLEITPTATPFTNLSSL